MKAESIELLCTLGPSSQNDDVIYWLDRIGVSLLRINLSHTRTEDLERIVTYIQSRTSVPICLDTEGAQIRTGALAGGNIALRENQFLTAHRRPVAGDQFNIALYPGYVVEKLQVGDLVSIDFNSVLSQVVEKNADGAVLRVLNGGDVGQNKAVTVQRAIEMTPLTDKDLEAIRIGRKLGVGHFALSFANCRGDVDLIRERAGAGATIISKIECLNGLKNLEAIASASDAILIDRGDLSREVPMEQIPVAQKMIIARAKACNTKAYVATNLLESMTTSPLPTRAEVNDIYNTLEDGADGLVLAAETAIGQYPVKCAKMVMKVVEQFNQRNSGTRLDAPRHNLSSPDAVEPHGGRLVLRTHKDNHNFDVENLPAIMVGDDELSDAEQICRGTFSPLTGFMDQECLESVLAENRLPSGLPWTMPVLLAVPKETATRFGKGNQILLTDSKGQVHSLLDVSQTYEMDARQLARKWFGTESTDHPGVFRTTSRGNYFMSGNVTLIQPLPSPYSRYDLTPAQLRAVFAHKGWSRVVGFHSRNLVHRAHEAVQLAALERTRADGLLINPVLGKAKKGDFLPNIVLDGYRAMLDYGLYPPGKVVLASFLTYPRFAGPREAVFTAICRKNMGCSHFVIGRDHSGVGSFYSENDGRKLFDTLGDIGIEPVFFNTIGYDAQYERYVDVSACETAQSISGSEIRRALTEGESLPYWMVRPEVQDVIRSEKMMKQPVFQE